MCVGTRVAARSGGWERRDWNAMVYGKLLKFVGVIELVTDDVPLISEGVIELVTGDVPLISPGRVVLAYSLGRRISILSDSDAHVTIFTISLSTIPCPGS